MIDSKDFKIIEVLKKDSRTPIREIAKLTGLKPSTVHLRIQGLIKKKIIKKFTVKLDEEAVNQGLEVFAYLTTEGIDPKIYDVDFIKKVLTVSGEYDTMLVMKFKDLQEYDDFFSKFKEIKGIKKTKTVVVSNRIKG